MENITGGTSTQNSNEKSATIKARIYRDLINFHATPVKDDLLQAGKPLNVLNNHLTAINKWMECAPWLNGGALRNTPLRSASPDDTIGDELGVDFEKCLAVFLRQMADEGLAPTTVKSRGYILRKVRRSWVRLLQSDGLPDDFRGALLILMKRSNVKPSEVARWCGLNKNTVRKWLDGSRLPSLSIIKHVAIIERRMSVQAGTLVYRLPSILWGTRWSEPERKNTPYREYLSKIKNKSYRLRYDSFTPEQQREWQYLFRFYTDPRWVAAQGLDRHPVGWRTRKNNNKNSTGEIKLADIENYYGFLCLPDSPLDSKLRGVEFDPNNESHDGVPGLDPQLTGMGLDSAKLSLALFTDASLLNEMITFMRRRSFGNSHSTRTRVFLALCAQLTRAEKGFLFQFPEYGERLEPQILNKEEWKERCREANKRIRQIISLIRNNRDKTERFNQTRDTTVEIVRPLIKEREHPITVLMDIADGLRHDFKRARSPKDKAVLFRNLILVLLVTSNPMRAINIAEMRYVLGAKGYENEAVNLYKLTDGSYRLKYEEGELKNGTGRGRYDLPVSAALTADLDQYFEVWRPLLIGADVCDYVFRPSSVSLPSLLSRNPDATIMPMATKSLSNIMRCASQIYVLPKCKGFGLHSARHFVATEYLKFNPGAYEIAATILHDSEKMVKETYSWVTPDDKVAFWNDHFTSVLRKIRKEAA